MPRGLCWEFCMQIMSVYSICFVLYEKFMEKGILLIAFLTLWKRQYFNNWFRIRNSQCSVNSQVSWKLFGKVKTVLSGESLDYEISLENIGCPSNNTKSFEYLLSSGMTSLWLMISVSQTSEQHFIIQCTSVSCPVLKQLFS